ncbi:glycosyl hydrolase family 65 protein [Lactobacillus acetotolerans]|uniref:glycosyl hydrolase family 65 protein n=1 Tax=Lactobacillus acetotolerans TaxID=1600 RepID=UPI0023EE28A7|nr:glycosyl hydrolase family 65 protein [Lactobacillus acetotolerans]
MQIEVNGHLLDLNQGKVSNYSRQLNLKNDLLTRQFIWTIDHQRYQFKFDRFVSMNNLHLVVARVSITPLDAEAEIKIKSGINGQETNSGTQHLIEGAERLFNGHYLQMLTKTGQSNINFAVSTCHKFNKIDGQEIKQQMEIGRRQIYCNYKEMVPKNKTFSFVKHSTLVSDRDNDFDGKDLPALQQDGLNLLKTSAKETFDQLLDETAKAWQDKVWQYGKIQIDSQDPDDQFAINFARYHLAIATPVHDCRMNIAAKGLTGEGYKGHTFWDTEIFMMPYYIFTNPKVAKQLIKYRYLGLAGAHAKAKANHYEGAQYPWEAAWPTDGETAPVWGDADIVTGKAMKIWSGFLEQHITSDVVYGASQYIYATGDKKFARNYVDEIVLDAAKFWSSRLEYNAAKDRYELNDVIGPDEYKEHVNNNAFTNYTAQWTIQTAVNLYKWLKDNEPEEFDKLTKKLGLKKVYPVWLKQVDKVYLLKPNADGVIPENDTYLTLRTINLDKYRNAKHVGGILKDYNMKQIDQIQVTKQADILLLLYLFEDKFAAKEKRINWNYYEPKTTHDSSLSLSTHATLAADLGMNSTSYNFFHRACQIDLGVDMHSSDAGIHTASLGGIWNSIIFGFGGVRLLNKKLRIEPHLPAEWKSLNFDIYWQGQRLHIAVNHTEFTVTALGAKKAIDFINNGKVYQLNNDEDVTIKLGDNN